MTDEQQPPADDDPQPDQEPPPRNTNRAGTPIFQRGTGGAIIGNVPSEETIQRELDVLRLRRAGRSFSEIALQVGYSDKSAASKAYHRALTRDHRPLVAEARQLEEGRLDDLLTAVWTKAMKGDILSVREALRISQRRAKLLGLDHADGIAERLVQIETDKLRLMALALGTALDRIGLTEDQATQAKRIMLAELRRLATVEADEADLVIQEIEGPPDPTEEPA